MQSLKLPPPQIPYCAREGEGASMYDVRKIFGFFCPLPHCHCHKSADFVPFVCFLGTPSPIATADVIYGSPLTQLYPLPTLPTSSSAVQSCYSPPNWWDSHLFAHLAIIRQWQCCVFLPGSACGWLTCWYLVLRAKQDWQKRCCANSR